MDHSTEVALWAQVTGLNITDVRRKPPRDQSVHYVDGQRLEPGESIELQIDGRWPDGDDGSQPIGVYMFNSGDE